VERLIRPILSTIVCEKIQKTFVAASQRMLGRKVSRPSATLFEVVDHLLADSQIGPRAKLKNLAAS
jgi:hypothetical protein